jgi:hypothetical protein
MTEVARVAVWVWLAFLLALALALPQPPGLVELAVGAAAGALLIAAGFACARALGRPPAAVVVAERGRRILLTRSALAVVAGAVLGLVLLAILAGLARVEPALRARMAGRLGEPAWRPWALAFESSIVEEVIFRLFLMTLAAWAVTRLLSRRAAGPLPFAIGLAVSTLAFGAAHVPAWTAVAGPSLLLVGGVVALNGIGGLLLGWVYWRWGLLLAILCHAAGDVVVQSLGPRLLG